MIYYYSSNNFKYAKQEAKHILVHITQQPRQDGS